MMEKFGISYDQLRNMPYEKFLDFRRIIRIENKEEKKRQEKQQKKAQKQTKGV